jgi:hypothetical protein
MARSRAVSRDTFRGDFSKKTRPIYAAPARAAAADTSSARVNPQNFIAMAWEPVSAPLRRPRQAPGPRRDPRSSCRAAPRPRAPASLPRDGWSWRRPGDDARAAIPRRSPTRTPVTTPPRITTKSGSSIVDVDTRPQGQFLRQERQGHRIAVGHCQNDERDRDRDQKQILDGADHLHRVPRIRSTVQTVQPVPQKLARLEERHVLFIDIDAFAGAGIAPDPGVALLHRKRAEAAQLDPVSAGQEPR